MDLLDGSCEKRVMYTRIYLLNLFTENVLNVQMNFLFHNALTQPIFVPVKGVKHPYQKKWIRENDVHDSHGENGLNSNHPKNTDCDLKRHDIVAMH